MNRLAPMISLKGGFSIAMVVVIAVAWGRLRERGDGLLIDQMLIASAANTGLFLMISLVDRNEYKFLM